MGFDGINKKNDTFQYVPILDTLNILLSHEDVLGKVKYPENSIGDGMFCTFSDGTSYKQNKLFSSNKDALQIILYHDDFNIVNPLGNKVKKHKISGFYFVLGNLPIKFRSKLRDIHLAILSPAVFVEKYGYASILQPLLEDIHLLEKHDEKSHQLYGALAMLIADNLLAHAIGGFFCNFSTVDRFCRFCMVQLKSINDVANSYPLRTEESYQAHVHAVTIDRSLASVYGIKSNSCLNILDHYHVANGLPPDIAHDILEGFAKDITSNLIKYLIRENYTSLKELNDSIRTFPYNDVDKKRGRKTSNLEV